MAVAGTWVQEFKRRYHHCWGRKGGWHKMWMPQYSVHGFTRPIKFISFQLSKNNRTWNPHLPKQNWTIIIMNIKSSPCPSQGQKVASKIFSPKRLARAWFYRAMCHVLCFFLAIWNNFWPQWHTQLLGTQHGPTEHILGINILGNEHLCFQNKYWIPPKLYILNFKRKLAISETPER